MKNKSKTAKPRKFPGDIHKFFIIKKIFKFGLPRTYSFSGDRTPFGIRKKSRYRRIGDYGGLSITSNWRLHHDDKYLFCYLYCGLAILVIQKTLQKLYITKRTCSKGFEQIARPLEFKLQPKVFVEYSSIWARFGLFRLVFGLFVVIWGHSVSFGVIWGHSRSFGVFWGLWSFVVIHGHSWSYGVIWVYSGPFRAILGHLELFGLGNSFILRKR